MTGMRKLRKRAAETSGASELPKAGASAESPPKAALQTSAAYSGPAGQPKEPFNADRADRIFAVMAFVLGFLFVRWVMLAWRGWGVTAFSVIYCGAVCLFFSKKGVRINCAGCFWMAATC
jgi:hypothetical protein